MDIKKYADDVCKKIKDMNDEQFDQLLKDSGMENCSLVDEPTTILQGDDLRDLVKDVLRPNTNQEGQKLSLELLEIANRRKPVITGEDAARFLTAKAKVAERVKEIRANAIQRLSQKPAWDGTIDEATQQEMIANSNLFLSAYFSTWMDFHCPVCGEHINDTADLYYCGESNDGELLFRCNGCFTKWWMLDGKPQWILGFRGVRCDEER